MYYLKLVHEKGRNRVKVLPGQTVKVNTMAGMVKELVRDDWNVMCDRDIRSKLPINSILCTDTLTVSSTHYKAGDLYVIETPSGTTIPSDVPEASTTVKAVYEAFRRSDKIVIPDEKEDFYSESDEPVVRRGTSFLSKLVMNPKLLPPKKEEGFFIDETKWYHLVRNIKVGRNTLLTGQAGTGKTEIVALIAERLGIPFYIFDMGSMYDAIAGLIGVHRMKEGKSMFDYSRFTEAIQQPSIVLLDEINRAPATSNNLLFPCLDFRRKLPAEMAGSDGPREFKVHDDCVFFATANLGGEYTGTSALDRALLDRFQVIEMNYLDVNDETTILKVRCKINTSEATQIAKVAEQIRELYTKNDLSSFISTRHTLQVGELVADGFPVLDALQMVILPLFEGSEIDTGSERSTVKSLLATR